MIFKKKSSDRHIIKKSGNSDIHNVHDRLIDKTEILELEDIADEKELDIDFDMEDDVIEVNESVELEAIDEEPSDTESEIELEIELTEEPEELELSMDDDIVEIDMEEDSDSDMSDDDSELVIEDISADESDNDYLEELDEIHANDISDGAVINFAKRWALVLSMAAASVVIGVGSVVAVTVKQRKTITVDAAATEEATTERFLLLTDDYKNVSYKTVSLEVVPEDTTITVNIMNSESAPCTGVLFKAVAVKGVVDDNREFLDEVVTHEQIEDFDTSDTVPFVQANDNDMDGTITFDNLDEDTYTVALLSASGYNPVEPVEVSTVKFDIIDNIIEKVVAESSTTIKEDPESGRNNAAAQPATSAPKSTTAATTASVPKKVEVVNPVKVDGDLVYDSSYGDTRELSDDEVKSYTSTVVNVKSGEGVAKLEGYILSTGEKKIGNNTVTYVSQMLVSDNTNVSLIDGFEFSIMQAADNTSSASTSKAGAATTTTTTTATQAQTTTKSQTTQPATTKAQTSAPTTTQPTTTQPTTVQPTTAAKKTYRVVNLEPVVEKKTETVYDDGWQNIDGSRYYYQDGKAFTGWHEIDGIQYYFSNSGVLSSRTVIDVSRFNGNIDWNAVKASGIDYAIIRVGYRGYESGTLVMDSMFETNMSGAIAAGIKVGAYIVTQAVNTSEAVEEASFIVQACSKYSISLPLVIDVETAGGGSGRGDKISASTRTAVINAYSQAVRNAGYTPMLYASKSWLEGRINTGSVYSSCKIWIARYNDTLGYSGRYNMWQFRSDGGVDGINGCVDISAWVN